ncbi:MAG: hypothetical protein ABIK81_02080 [candidate division WOR-3 bacterium]
MSNFFLKDFSLKVFALILSLIIWFFATLERNYVVSRRLPIRFKELSPLKVISYQSTEFVDLILEGKGRNFLLWRRSDLSYDISLEEIRLGRQRVKFKAEDLNLGEGLRVVGFRPEYFDFEIDNLGEKPVGIKISWQGEMTEGFFLTDWEVLDTVLLFGPKGELPFISFLSTEPFSLKGIKKSAVKELKVIPPDKKGFWVQPEKIRVRLTVEPETTVTVGKVLVKIDRGGVKVVPKEAEITISGAPSRLRAIKEEEIKVLLTVDTLKPGVYYLPAQIFLPSGVSFKRCEPDKFQVEIR